MSKDVHSAGTPGADRCSDPATGKAPTQAGPTVADRATRDALERLTSQAPAQDVQEGAAGRWIVGRWSDLYGPPPERPIYYVARADAGGRLIVGRLSDYFEGDAGRDAAYELRDSLRRSGVPDASVFSAETRERAEQLLSGEGACHG